MLSLAHANSGRHHPVMVKPGNMDDAEVAAALGAALRNLRTRNRISQQTAGDAFGITAQGWGKYESGRAPSIFKPDVQRRLAEAIGVDMDVFQAETMRLTTMHPSGTPSRLQALDDEDVSRLPIRRRVQAGAWLAVEEHDEGTYRSYPAAPDPRFSRKSQWLSEVTGDSMDKLGIREGDLVHCVDIIDIGYHPRTGDVVEVERIRFQGSEREVTLKQVEVTPSAVLLWPRSSNPRWHAPLELTEGAPNKDDIEVQIRGLVLSSIRRFHSI